MFILKEGTKPDESGIGTDEATRKSIVVWLEKDGATVRTQEQDIAYVGQKAQEEVDVMYRKHNETIDIAIAEATGINKKGNEKTSDFLKRALQENTSGISDLKAKIKEYEDKGVSGNEQAEKYKAELEQLQGQFSTQKEEYESKLKDQSDNMFMNSIKMDIQKDYEIIKVNLRDDINKDVIADVLENRMNKFYAENKPERLDNENIIWKGNDGKTKNSTKDGKPLNGTELLAGYFTDLVKIKRNGKGSGSGGEGGKGGEGANSYENINLPETVKSKVQLYDHLTKVEKLDSNTKEFTEAYNALGADLPIKNPRV